MSETFQVDLVDGVSGPARSVTRGFQSVADGVTEAATRMGIYRDAQGKLRNSSGRFASEQEKAAAGLANVSSGMAGAVAKGTMLGNVYTWAAGKVAQLAQVAASAAVSLGMAVAKAAAFSQQMRLTLGLMMHSDKAGSAAFEATIKLANQLGLDVFDTAKQYQKLVAMQFKASQANDIIKLSADMKALGASTQEVQSIMRAFGQIKGKGVLQMEELQGQLAETGISVALVVENLGKRLGKTTNEVRKMISAGKVSADIALEAVKDTVKQKLGIQNLGDAAIKSGRTLGGMWDRMKSAGQIALLRFSEALLPLITGKIAPALAGITSFLNSKDGAATIGKLAKAFDSVGTAIDMVGDMRKRLGLKESNALIDALVVVVQGLAIGIGVITVAAGAASAAFEVWWDGMVRLGSAIQGAWQSVVASFGSATDMVASIGTSGQGIGTALVDGFVAGIESGIIRVAQAATNMAQGAVSAAKGALAINSPSRVFEWMGDMSAAGYTKSLDANAGDVQNATARMVMPRALPGGGGQVNQTNNIGVTVNESANVEETMRLIERQLGPQVIKLFARLAAQSAVMSPA